MCIRSFYFRHNNLDKIIQWGEKWHCKKIYKQTNITLQATWEAETGRIMVQDKKSSRPHVGQ
jgi:hypothetical protein